MADGLPYEVCTEPGDVVLAHPFLAHGIGTNITENPRFAVYCRIHADQHKQYRQQMLQGDAFQPNTWMGDIFNLQPGMKK